jgi:hypothetical protein
MHGLRGGIWIRVHESASRYVLEERLGDELSLERTEYVQTKPKTVSLFPTALRLIQ